jgi:hypothetical protein
MSAKGLMRALAGLAALLVLWAAFALFRGSIADTTARLSLPQVTAADVDRVAIARGGDTVVLVRVPAGWQVNGHPADGAQTDQLFRALTDTGASSELLARQAASHGRLGVDSAGRRVVFAKGSDTLLALVVGEQGRAFQTAYVRLADASEVFLYRGALPGLLSRNEDAWRDRRIAQVPPDFVGAMIVTRGGRDARLTRTESGWTVAGGAADTVAVQRALRALSDLAAIGFATQAQVDSLDFSRPWGRVTVMGRRGDTLLALEVDSTASGYWVRRAGAGDVYRVDFWRLDQLMPTPNAWRAGSP